MEGDVNVCKDAGVVQHLTGCSGINARKGGRETHGKRARHMSWAAPVDSIGGGMPPPISGGGGDSFDGRREGSDARQSQASKGQSGSRSTWSNELGEKPGGDQGGSGPGGGPNARVGGEEDAGSSRMSQFCTFKGNRMLLVLVAVVVSAVATILLEPKVMRWLDQPQIHGNRTIVPQSHVVGGDDGAGGIGGTYMTPSAPPESKGHMAPAPSVALSADGGGLDIIQQLTPLEISALRRLVSATRPRAGTGESVNVHGGGGWNTAWTSGWEGLEGSDGDESAGSSRRRSLLSLTSAANSLSHTGPVDGNTPAEVGMGADFFMPPTISRSSN